MSIRLPDLAELPERVPAPSPATLAVWLTYRRILSYATVIRAKGTKERVPVYGGAIAVYPKETGFTLDRSSLLQNK